MYGTISFVMNLKALQKKEILTKTVKLNEEAWTIGRAVYDKLKIIAKRYKIEQEK